MIAPNADMFGHISGIIAALVLKYLGLYSCRLMPQYAWIAAVESNWSAAIKDLHAKLGYFPATDAIETEFAYCQRSLVEMLQ